MGHILLQKLGFKQRPIRFDDMPQGFLDTQDASLRDAAHDLDNYLPPAQNIHLLRWRRGINSTGVNDPPTPSSDSWKIREGSKITRTTHAEVTTTQDALSESDILVTWEYISRPSAYLDYMVIRLNDEVVDCQLERQYSGFMYYDNQAATLQEIIERRGVYVPVNDAVTKVHSFFLKHGVRVYQEVKTDDGPRFKYLGDYFIHRTQKTLNHADWELLSEEVKERIVMRYVNASVTGLDDPCPGSKFSPANVRKWYDMNDVLPLVILHPTGRTLSEPTRPSLPFQASVASQTVQPQAKSFMNMDEFSDSTDERSAIAVSDIEERVFEYARASGMVLPDVNGEEGVAPNSASIDDIPVYYTHDGSEDTSFINRHVYTAKALKALIDRNDDLYKATRQGLFELSGDRTRAGWEYSKILQALEDIEFGQVSKIASFVEQERECTLITISSTFDQDGALETNNDSEGSGGTERMGYPAANDPNPPPGYF